MTGEIKLKIKKGISKDPRYEYYPYWYLEITGESGQKINITPSFAQLRSMLLDIFEHEKAVDMSRSRKPDAPKWIKFLNDTLDEARFNSQTTKQFFKPANEL